MRIHRIVLAALAVTTLAAVTPHAQEHPSEHPSKHKESTIDIQTISTAIRAYVKNDAQLKGGYFLVYDPVAKVPLALTLQKVHEDKLATLGGGVYFACADFKSTDGKLYDIDIFMRGDPSDLRPTDVSIHKVDGTPRYTWVEKDGVWMKNEVN